MPFNPAEFVFQPRPLQQFDLGAGFRALAEQRMDQKRLAENARQANMQNLEQQQGRADQNTRFSAELASNRANASRAEQMQKYQQGVALTDAARKAVAAGDWNTADALAGRITELGGKVDKTVGEGGRPIYSFRAPGAPGQAPIDYAQQRREIFGGDAGNIGSPFPMRSNVAGGQPEAGKNPFEMLPGASAAALPQHPQSAEPAPPGAAADPSAGGSGTPPAGTPSVPDALPTSSEPSAAPAADPSLAPTAQTAAAGADGQPLQLTPPNPFDPFKLDTNALIGQNELRLQPYLEGARRGIPAPYQGRFDALNKATAGLALPPEETLQRWQPTANMIAGLIGDEIRSEGQKASLGLRSESAENTRNDRLVRNAQSHIERLSKQYDLANNNKRYMAAAETENLLKDKTGSSDTAALRSLFRMYTSGVMTDKDFEQTKNGAVLSLWDQVKRGTDAVFNSRLHPDVRAELMRLIETSRGSIEKNLRTFQRQAMTTVRSNRTGSAEARDAYLNTIAEYVPDNLWDPDVREAMGVPLDDKSGPMDQSGNYAIPPSSGTTKTKTSGVAKISKKMTSIGKPVDKLTEEDWGKLPIEEAEKLYQEAGVK